jgi:hypothetical protein
VSPTRSSSSSSSSSNNNNNNNNNNYNRNNNRNNNNRNAIGSGSAAVSAVLSSAYSEDSGLDVGRLSAMFESEGLKLSNKLLGKVKDACQLFRCNGCRAHFDHFKELTEHLKDNRNHLVNPGVINLRKIALIQRIHGPDGTTDERKFPLNFETMTPAQKRTLIELAIDRAYFERIRRFL